MNQEDEARRNLERIEREREKLIHGSPSASDDDNDPVVKLGKRIAHILGPLVAVGLVVYLFATYMT